MNSHLSEFPRASGANDSGSVEKSTTHPSLLDLGVDFGRAALYSGIQAPITGVSQLIDQVADTHISKSLSFISAPEHAEFGSADWHAQQLGGALGTVLPFLAIHKGMSTAFKDTALLSNPISQGASSGFVFGTIFQPSNDGANFWSSRLKNGVSTGITFGALSGLNGAIGKVAESEALSGTFAQKVAANPIFSGVISGVPAGLVGAEAESLLNGKGFASGQDLVQSAYGYGLIGGAFGALSRFERPSTNQSADSSHSAKMGQTDSGLKADSIAEPKLLSRALAEEPLQTRVPELPTHGRDGMEVVLGAGGVRGFGLVGFLRYLEDQRVKIGTETGVSIGSIVGALHSNGYSPRQIEQIMKDELVHSDMQSLAQSHQPLRHPLRTLGSHFISMRTPMENFVAKYNLTPQDNLRIVAYNLSTRKPIVFEGKNYDLAEALAASSSIPGAMRPIYYRPAKGELPESMRKGGLLVDGGAYRMAPSEFSDQPAIIAKISAQSPFPSLRGRSLRELPSLIQPAIFAAFKKRYTETEGPHLVVSVGDTTVDALDMHLPDVKINDLIQHGYTQAKTNLDEHVAQGDIPLEPVVFSTPVVDQPASQQSILAKLFARLHNRGKQ